MIEVKVSYDCLNEEGFQIKKNESYLVYAQTFGSAEAMIYQHAEILSYTNLRVKTMKESKYMDVLCHGESVENEKFYAVKVNSLTLNEVNGKTKKTPMYFLVIADSTTSADKSTRLCLDNRMYDYEVVSIKDCAIVEVID